MLRRRGLSTATRTISTPRVAPQPSRSVLEISGPDAQKFLKGQMCKDVDSLGGGYSGFLNASGRVLHTVFCVPNKPNSYLISHDSGAGQPSPLGSLLPPFRLRAKVRIKDVSDEWDVWGAWGAPDAMPPPDSSWRFGNGGAAERVWTWLDGERAPLGLNDSEVGCWDLRAGWGGDSMGKQIFVPKGQKPSLLSTHDLGTTDEYNLRRMLLGVPEGTDEVIPGHALPLESDMDIQGGVDFRKGCYLGQELTVRTYHTGATRKRILPVWLYDADAGAGKLGEQPIAPLLAPARSMPGLTGGAHHVDITYTPPSSAASKKSRSAGKLLALSNSASGVGLALIRLEWADRACWAGGDRGQLTVELEGKKYGLVVGKGEAYAAALADTPPPVMQDDEAAMARA